MSDKKNLLSDTDRALFRGSMKDVKPINRHKKVHFDEKPDLPEIKRRAFDTNESQLALPNHSSVSDHVMYPVSPDAVLYFHRHALNRKQTQSLKRGDMHIDAAIDLHGMNAAQAKTELLACIAQCKAEQWRWLRVIHGKGYSNKSQPAKLKNLVNHWLPQLESVVAFASCPPHQGGTGAVNVRLQVC